MTKVPTFEKPAFEVDEEVVQELSDSFANTVKTIMAGNFLVSLLLASALQYLWGMVNSLQIIVLEASLFNCLLPSNSQVV